MQDIILGILLFVQKKTAGKEINNTSHLGSMSHSIMVESSSCVDNKEIFY
tara:strand:+ start:1463 stop:1612 length:150 start_codon:yes stop_codon:yes gene_type:complete